MYVRTELRVYQVIQEYTDFYVVKDGNVNPALPKSFVLTKSDDVKELCDGFYIDFVNYKGFDKDKIGEPYTFEEFRDCFMAYREYEGNQYTHCEGYGFIKTNKGLIYVAKMNQKGELELL